MHIILTVLTVLLAIILLLIFSDIKVYVEFDNLREPNILKLKAYAFSYIPVFWITKTITKSSEKSSIKDKIDSLIDYFIKSKADPVDFAVKKVKKSTNIPDMIKKFDFKEIYLERLSLRLCLDFDNAAVSAIATGAINAIIGMVFSKYADNIVGPVNYKIFPGYTGNGIKINVSLKAKVRAVVIIKALLSSQRRKEK